MASGPALTPVQSLPLPPAQEPTLCGSQVAWLDGPDILLQALFADAGIHVFGCVVHCHVLLI